MRRKEKPRKSVLQDYMRDAYEEFADLLIREILKKHPKGKAPQIIREATQKLIEEHFGKDHGGTIFFD